MAEDKTNNNDDSLEREENELDDLHQVEHLEDVYVEDAKKIAFTHWVLVALSFFGMAAIIFGGWFMFVTFEGRLQEQRAVEAEQARLEALKVPTLAGPVFYQREAGTAKTTLLSLSESAEQTTVYDQKLVEQKPNTNPVWQISDDGYVVAFQTGQSKIEVKRVNEEFEVTLPEQIYDWKLSSNGRLIAMHTIAGNKDKLQIYDLAVKKVIMEDADYINSMNGDVSKLHYGNDAVIRHFSISAPGQIETYRFSIYTGAFDENLIFESRRIGDGASLIENSISPDGSQVIHRYSKDGGEWLGISSLNSGTVRDIYKPPNNSSRIGELAWASDSRSVAFTEEEGGEAKRVVVLDSGPTTFKVVADDNKEGLDPAGDIAQHLKWQDDGKILAFVNGGKLILMTVEGQEFTTQDPFSPITSPQLYGWYYR